MTSPFYLPSKLLTAGPVVAGFSTGRGGGDTAGLARSAGFAPDRLFMVHQVHGSDIVSVSAQDAPEAFESRPADGLVTADGGVALAVRTADCVPVLLATPPGAARPTVAAVHAGWRGFVAGIPAAGVAEVCRISQLEPESLRAAVGPAIGPCCFEVGDDVASTIAAATGTESVILRSEERTGARPHVDLRRAVVSALATAGLEASHIELVGPCTRCAAAHFHSYRREGAGGGRQLSFVSLHV